MFALLLILSGPRPAVKSTDEHEHLVKAIEVPLINVSPSIVGYGEVQASRTWKSVSQLAGKVEWRSPKLKSGEFFKKGELLLKIDGSEIALKISSCKAEIAKYAAKLEELEKSRVNLESQIEISTKILDFNQRNLSRQQTLLKAQAVSASTVETEEITVLQQKNSLVSLESELRILPAQIAYQKAGMDAALSDLAKAELDSSYAKITAPFDCRIATLSVEEAQYVAVGQEMFTADSTDEVEIPVQFSIDQMELLLGLGVPDKLASGQVSKPPELKIRIKVNGGRNSFYWTGRFLRMASGADSVSRMMGMVVAVKEPYGHTGKPKPPLDKGLFCSVEVKGAPSDPLAVIPRSAVHAGMVYLAGRESRLEIKPVTVKAYIKQYAIISEGISKGDGMNN